MFSVFRNDDRHSDVPEPHSLKLEDIRSALPEIVRLNRLARSSVYNGLSAAVNDKERQLLYLETPNSDLFNIFKRGDSARDTDVHMEDVTPIDSNDQIQLLSITNLGLETTTTIEPGLNFNLREYRLRRQALINKALSTVQAATPAFEPEPMHGVESNEQQPQAQQQWHQEAQAAPTQAAATTISQAAEMLQQSSSPALSSTERAVQITTASSPSKPTSTTVTIAEPTSVTSETATETNAIIASASTAPEATVIPSVSIKSVSIPKERIDSMYKDEYVTNTSSDTTKKIYTYPNRTIPIFASLEQRLYTDKKVTKGSAFQWKTILHGVVDHLNMPSTFPVNIEDTKLSGKLLFIQSLFDSLAHVERNLAIIVQGLEAESSLEVWMENLGLQHARISNVGDNSWAGDYGVVVKTRREMNRPANNSSLKLKAMPNGIDLILCLDARLNRTPSPFLQNIKGRLGKPAPTAWLITLGCIEEYVNRFLTELPEPISFDDALKEHAECLKRLLKEPSAWPSHEQFSEEVMTEFVADHVAQWIELAEKWPFEEFQFKTTVELPRATHTANLLSPSTDATATDRTVTEAVPSTATPASAAVTIAPSAEVDVPAADIDVPTADGTTSTTMLPSATEIAETEVVSTAPITVPLLAEVPEDNDTQDMDISDSEDAPVIIVPGVLTATTSEGSPTLRTASGENELFKLLDNEQLFSHLHDDQKVATYEQLLRESVTDPQLKEKLAIQYRSLQTIYAEKMIKLQKMLQDNCIKLLKQTYDDYTTK